MGYANYLISVTDCREPQHTVLEFQINIWNVMLGEQDRTEAFSITQKYDKVLFAAVTTRK